MTVFIHKVCHT